MSASRRPDARQLGAAARTDTGRLRSHNEDRLLCDPELGVYAVIDGVGGAVAGETGAREAAAVLEKRLGRRQEGTVEQQVREAVALANNRIYELAAEDPRLAGMACVLTVAVVDGERVVVGHVGDTRLYRISAERIEKCTRDHSPVGEMEDEGELSELEAMRHPRRNEIYRDVGTAWHRPDDSGFVDVFEVPFGSADALVLCSDGLSDQVRSAEILRVVAERAGRPREAAEELVAMANAAGGKDNVSVVIVEGERFGGRPAAAATRKAAPGEATRRLRPVPSPPRRSSPGQEAASAATGAPESPPERRLRAAAAAAPSHSGGAPSSDAVSFEPAAVERGPVAVPPPRRPAPFGAGRARGASGRWPLSPASVTVVVLVLALAALGLWRRDDLARWRSLLPLEARILEVGPDSGFTTIAAALDAARWGHVVEVEPGTYDERLELVDGVTLRSRVPGAAILRPTREATLEEMVAVRAVGVSAGRLEGLRISGSEGGSVDVGVLLLDSSVEVENVEIEGAVLSAVRFGGGDRSSLHYSHLHDNPGRALLVEGAAAPKIVHNLVRASGAAGAGAPSALEVRDQALPIVVGNQFRDNPGVAVRVPSPVLAEAIAAQNSFEPDSAERTVETVAAPPRGEGEP